MLDINRDDVAFALRIVRQAAALTQRVQQEMVLEGLTKSDLSPVTVADYAVQALVGQGIEDAFPDDALIGEESAADLRTDAGAPTLHAVARFVAEAVSGATPEQVCDWIDRGAASSGRRFWTVDPVDGTKGYLRGGHYAVALALVEDGEVKLGALACPKLDRSCRAEPPGDGALLIACRGDGAWCTALADVGAAFDQLQVSSCTDATHARILRSFESGHTHAGDIDAIADHLYVTLEPVRMDSQAKYAVLASGGAELLLRLLAPGKRDYKEKIWDQAAGAIILEEAGGRITDLYGQPLDFSQGRTLANNTGVFASNGALHERGLEAIRAVGAV